MTNTFEPDCVLKVDAGYIATVLAESGQPVPDDDRLSDICNRLGERWVSDGTYDRISEEIIETAEETA